jgi:hypothetical protein
MAMRTFSFKRWMLVATNRIQHGGGQGDRRPRELSALVEEKVTRAVIGGGVLRQQAVPLSTIRLRQFQGDETGDSKNAIASGREQKRAEISAILHSDKYHENQSQERDVQEGQQQNLDRDGGARFHESASMPGFRIM